MAACPAWRLRARSEVQCWARQSRGSSGGLVSQERSVSSLRSVHLSPNVARLDPSTEKSSVSFCRWGQPSASALMSSLLQ